jgi:hypothetical protein
MFSEVRMQDRAYPRSKRPRIAATPLSFDRPRAPCNAYVWIFAVLHGALPAGPKNGRFRYTAHSLLRGVALGPTAGCIDTDLPAG